MNDNEKLIQQFYTCFQNKDYKGMQACYTDDILFSDNAFVGLKGKRAKAMWHMLAVTGRDLQLTFEGIKADQFTGSCNWIATYTFSLTGNRVVNHVHAEFIFRDGKIAQHLDSFDFWKWASQAFGLRGRLLGWTSFFRNKVQSVTKERLNAFIEKNPEYKS
jgi:ketosteroid isomerase-like protein